LYSLTLLVVFVGATLFVLYLGAVLKPWEDDGEASGMDAREYADRDLEPLPPEQIASEP
jgi:hypothetical protein